eukprot:TCONS_00068747-protein
MSKKRFLRILSQVDADINLLLYCSAVCVRTDERNFETGLTVSKKVRRKEMSFPRKEPSSVIVTKLKKHAMHIENFLGKGAWGNVYACRKSFGGSKKYAAKVVEFGNDLGVKWQTENEIEILKEVGNHGNIVGFHGVVRDTSSIAMILEFIPGGSFLEGLLNWPGFNENGMKIIAKQLLEALKFCHSNRIIHRDVCPENILWFNVPTVKRPDVTPVLKLIDFNLSRKVPEDSTFLRADALGNPSYMAPECLSDEPIATFSGDIWSVGVLMFLLQSGYPPFFNDNYNHLLKNIQEANFVFPQHLWSHVTDDGKAIIQEILQQEPENRPTASELLTHRWFRTRISTATPIIIKTTPINQAGRYLFRTQNNSSTLEEKIWAGQKRLKGFLRHLNEKKTRANHRKYSLVFKERQAFIPESHMITIPTSALINEVDFYQQKVAATASKTLEKLNNSIESLEFKRQSFHW